LDHQKSGEPALGFRADSVEPAGTGFALMVLKRKQRGETNMLWTVLLVLFVLWLLGVITHIGGGLVHLLLIVALVLFVVELLSGRRVAL